MTGLHINRDYEFSSGIGNSLKKDDLLFYVNHQNKIDKIMELSLSQKSDYFCGLLIQQEQYEKDGKLTWEIYVTIGSSEIGSNGKDDIDKEMDDLIEILEDMNKRYEDSDIK